MTAPMHRHNLKFAVTILLLAASICIGIQPFACAQSPQIPQPWQEFYYYDEANILDEPTRADILAKGVDLQQRYGAQLVVMTVQNLPAGDYAQRVAYLRSVMDSWQVGGGQSRGVLLALAVADGAGGDYLVVAGEGLKRCFTTETLKTLLDAHLEPDFSTGAYSAGVTKFMSAAVDQAEGYFAQHPEEVQAGGSEKEPEKKGAPVLLWVGVGVGILAALGALGFFVLSRQGGLRRNRRSVHRRNPVITPARSNVTLHESHPTVHIKHSTRSSSKWK